MCHRPFTTEASAKHSFHASSLQHMIELLAWMPLAQARPRPWVMQFFFRFSVSFRASIGINSFEAYLQGITDETPDMTNFKARRLFSSVLLSFTGKLASGPNTFTWALNGTKLGPVSAADGSWTINKATLADEGEYQVSLSNRDYGTLLSRKIKLKFSG